MSEDSYKRVKVSKEKYESLLMANAELVEAIRNMTGHNLPTAYRDDEDDAGHCPYCRGWNMEHKDYCTAAKAEKIADRYEVSDEP